MKLLIFNYSRTWLQGLANVQKKCTNTLSQNNIFTWIACQKQLSDGLLSRVTRRVSRLQTLWGACQESHLWPSKENNERQPFSTMQRAAIFYRCKIPCVCDLPAATLSTWYTHTRVTGIRALVATSYSRSSCLGKYPVDDKAKVLRAIDFLQVTSKMANDTLRLGLFQMASRESSCGLTHLLGVSVQAWPGSKRCYRFQPHEDFQFFCFSQQMAVDFENPRWLEISRMCLKEI